MLKHPKVELKRKLTMVQSHLLGGGLYQCGTWGHIPQNVYGRIFHAIMYAYWLATGNKFDADKIDNLFSDADLIQEYNLVPPCCMIRACRLTLYARLILKAPTHILELVRNMYQFDIGWIQALNEDLLWLSLAGELPCSCDDFVCC